MPPVRRKYWRNRSSNIVTVNTRRQSFFQPTVRKFGAIIGHSFIKNVIEYVRDRLIVKGEWADVTSGRVWEAVKFAKELRLDNLFAAVSLQWAYLFEDDCWKKCIGLILAATPQILVVNIGSNDLCEIMRKAPNDKSGDKMAVESLVKRLIIAGCEWRDKHGVQVVVYMSVLRRTAHCTKRYDRFIRNMGRFNDEMNRYCDDEPGLVMKNVEGFDCHPDGTAMAVEDWSPDGAHPGKKGDDESFHKYLQELRAALHNSVPRLWA